MKKGSWKSLKSFSERKNLEEVKEAISIIEKEALLLSLIPIAFNEELESEVQIASLLVETTNSINICIHIYFILTFYLLFYTSSRSSLNYEIQ